MRCTMSAAALGGDAPSIQVKGKGGIKSADGLKNGFNAGFKQAMK